MDIVPLAKKRGAGRPRRDETAPEWWPVFVAEYRKTGSALLAGEAAGVDPKTARHYRRSNREAHRQARHAKRLFEASMQYELVRQSRGESKGSFLSTVARIKAASRRLHALYSEKVADAQVLNLTINNTAVITPEQGLRLLRESLTQVTPATQKLLGAGQGRPEPAILDAEVTP